MGKKKIQSFERKERKNFLNHPKKEKKRKKEKEKEEREKERNGWSEGNGSVHWDSGDGLHRDKCG